MVSSTTTMGAAASAQPELAGLSADTTKALEGLPEAAKAELLAALKTAKEEGSAKEDAAAAKLQAIQRGNNARAAADISKWGKSVFKQFDTDKNGKLSNKELTRALKSLPKVKPKTMPSDAKFMTVEQMIESMDADGDGGIDLNEWLSHIQKCVGLHAALAENVNDDGKVANFRSFEEQKAKREKEVAALEAKETRTPEEDKELEDYKAQIVSLAKKIEEANANEKAGETAA